MKISKSIAGAFIAVAIVVPHTASAVPPYSPPGTLFGNYQERISYAPGYVVKQGCLQASGVGQAPLEFAPCVAGKGTQMWMDTPSNGGWELRNTGTGDCLTTDANGTNLVFMAKCEADRGMTQRWTLTNSGANGWSIRNVHSGRCFSSLSTWPLVMSAEPCNPSVIYQRWY